MRRRFALLAFVLVACSPSQPAASVSPHPSQSPAATAPSGSPSPVADLPVTQVDFSCRLPVVTSTLGSDGVTFHGGFLNLPDAQLKDDPSGLVQSRYVQQDFATKATPVLHGIGGVPFYDRAQSRWVPVPARQSLPDGSAYAYVSTNPLTDLSKLYVVSVASGRARVFNLRLPKSPQIVDYSAAGVYLLSSSGLGGPGHGVWLFNPATGATRQLSSIAGVWAVRDGYAWVARFDLRDKTVWQPYELAPANSLVRIDLSTGAETVWFYRAGAYPWFLGFDAQGRPALLLGASTTSNEVRLVEQPGSAGVVVSPGTSQLDAIQGDGERLWFGGAHGIYLFRPGVGLQRVFAFDADPTTSTSIQPAGFCA